MKDRENKITGGMKKDIHESNEEYLINSYNNALYIAEKYKWDIISCVKNKELRSIEDIHEEIYNLVVDSI